MMRCRGIRGATTVDRDQAEQVYAATRELLREIVRRNNLQLDNIASAWFTVSPDLRSAFPATAARHLGWLDVPLMSSVEINVPGSLPHCIRILLHVNTTKSAAEIEHVYLRDAANLRSPVALHLSD